MNHSACTFKDFYSKLAPNTAVIIEREPRMIKSADVPILSYFIGSLDTSFTTTSTATPVSNAKAIVSPTSTMSGGCSAARVMVMSWVLPPSSMRAIIEKVANRGRWLFFLGAVSFSFLRISGTIPNTMKTAPETVWTMFRGRNARRDPPTRVLTPSITRKVSIAPKKTCLAYLELSDITASWVLSPNSPTTVSRNVVMMGRTSINKLDQMPA